MAQDKLEIQIAVKTAITQALTDLKNLQEQTQKARKEAEELANKSATFGTKFNTFKKELGGVITNMTGLSTASFGVAGVLSGLGLALKAAFDEARSAEIQTKQLTQALRSVGKEDSLKFFEDYRDKLEETTMLTDEQSTSLIALALNFGVSTNKVKDVVDAAADLKATFGVDASAAVEALTLAMGGNLRAIGSIVPGIKLMTEEEKKHLDILQYVKKNFGEAAENEMKGFDGQLKSLTTSTSRLLEVLGTPLVGALTAIMDYVNLLIENSLKPLFAFIGDLGSSLGNSFKSVGLSIGNILGFVDDKTFKNEMSKTVYGAYQESLADIKKSDDRITLKISNKKENKSADEIEEIKKQQEAYNSLYNQLKTAGLDEQQRADQRFSERLKDIEALKSSESKKTTLKKLAEQEYYDVIFKLDDERADRELANQAAIQKQRDADHDKEMQRLEQERQMKINIANSLISGVKQGGREGAISAVSGTLQSLFKDAGPEIAAFASAVEFLSQDADKIKEQIDGFLDAFVEIPVKISENIPMIIEHLANKIPDVAIKLGEAMPYVAVRLAAQLPFIAYQFAFELARQAPYIASELVKSISRGVTGGVSSVGSGVGGFFKKLGFADGGMVPSFSGVPSYGDNIGVFTNPGEIILNKSQQQNLASSINGGSDVTNTLIMQLMSMIQQPQVVSTSVQLNNKEFANIILQLNRSNARLS